MHAPIAGPCISPAAVLAQYVVFKSPSAAVRTASQPQKPTTRTQSLTASDDSCMYTRLLLEASAARDSSAVPVTPRPRTTSAPPSLVHVLKIKRAPLQQQRNSQKRTLGTLIEVDELAYTAKSAARMKPLPCLPSDSPIRKTAARRSNEGELVLFGWMAVPGRKYGSLVGASVEIMEGLGCRDIPDIYE